MSIPTPESSSPPYNALGISQDDKTMAMLAHLLGIVTGFVGPLVIWLIKTNRSSSPTMPCRRCSSSSP